MSMMRRGPLDRYPAEWVLRQANAHQVGGSIEFHTERPTTFFLDDGRIYAAVEGTSADGEGAIELHDETQARAQAVGLLVQALASTHGWYYLDPLGHHPARGSWQWEMASLLMETRARSHEETALVSWADRRIRLHEVPAAITLDPDAWAVVVSLARSATANDLRAQLGWSPARLLTALTQLDQRAALDPDLDHQWATAKPEPLAAPAADAARHTGPLTPPPSWQPVGVGEAPSRSRLRSLRSPRKQPST